MHIVVTRPAGQNQSLLDALAKQGVQASALPLLAICPLTAESAQAQLVKDTLAKLADYQHVIFVSTNAIEQAFYWIHQQSISLPQTIRWYPIGRASADALAAYVEQVEQAGVDMDSEGLLKNPQLQNLTGQKVLIFRGQDGRMLLHDSLTARGARVDFCTVYQRLSIVYHNNELSALLDKSVDGFIATSVQTVQALFNQAEKEQRLACVLNKILLVPGLRVAKYATQMGFNAVFSSQNAGVPAIMQTLNHIAIKKGVSCE